MEFKSYLKDRRYPINVRQKNISAKKAIIVNARNTTFFFDFSFFVIAINKNMMCNNSVIMR